MKAEDGKVTAILTLGDQPPQTIADITRSDKNLVLRYTFDYQGTAVDTAITLTPAADGPMAVQIDFAGGAYLMTGTATRKEKGK